MVVSAPEEQHASALTRETVTAAVQYLRFAFSEALVDAFAVAPEVALVATHPACGVRRVLTPEAREELRGDLRGTTKRLPMG